MSNKVILIDGEPRCPICGGHKFDTTFELISAGQWIIESIYCYDCETKLESTDELERFIHGEKWTVCRPVGSKA